MTLELLLLFTVTELILSLSPGPATLLVVSHGVRFGFRASLLGSLGVMTGEMTYFLLSALGLSAVLLASGTLFLLVKWAGAIYLVYLGTRLLSGERQSKSDASTANALPMKLYRQGLFMQLANPKALLFFTALLPQFIDPQAPVAFQFLVLGSLSMSVQFPTLILYGWLASRGGGWLRRSRYVKWLERVAGSFLVAAGVKLAFSGRPR